MRLLDGEAPYHPHFSLDPRAMERAHVLIRLRDDVSEQALAAVPHAESSPADSPLSHVSIANIRTTSNSSKADGITRTSATTVRLEHSEMSPGVASITFEQVYDEQHSNAAIFEQSLAHGVAKCVLGHAMSLVMTGAPRSGKSFTCHGDKQQEVAGIITFALRHVFAELGRLKEIEPELEYQVLLSCLHVVDDQLVDLLENPPAPIAVQPSDVEQTLTQRSITAGNAVEAVHYYSQALSRSTRATNGSSDFVFALHIETRKANEQVRRGRFMCIDIHGSRDAAEQQHNVSTGTQADPTIEDNDISEDNQADAIRDPPPGSPVSATSSDSTSDFVLASNDTVYDRWKARRAGGSGTLDQATKQRALSQRLQQAYEAAKSSSLGDPPTGIAMQQYNHVGIESGRGKHDRFEGLFATKANFLHAKADAMLKSRTAELQALSLLDKLELIHTQYQEVEAALAHETSVKEKCVDRISKLSQTMSFHVVEHEKQIQQVILEKEHVQAQLDDMELKFGNVSSEIEQLQQQVQLMKVSRDEEVSVPMTSPPSSGISDRALLQTFSSRLEAAMEEAKGVVDFKDGIIRDLERRLEEFAQLKLSRELEQQALLSEIKALKSLVQSKESASAQAAAHLQHQNAELTAKISQLSSEMETLHKRRGIREQEYEQTLATAVQQSACSREHAGGFEGAGNRCLEEMLAKKTRECIITQAASAANQRKVELLQTHVEEVLRKTEGKKKKMEKKVKALVHDRKSHKSAAARYLQELTTQIEDAQRKEQLAEKELAALRSTIQQHESNAVTLRSELERMQGEQAIFENHCSELQQRIGVLEAANADLSSQRHALQSKFERQIYELEQSSARRLVEKEARLTAEHERKMKKMMERHSTELLRREGYMDTGDVPRSRSPQSRVVASTISDSESPCQQQQSIDQLDALIDSKEKQYARSKGGGTPNSSGGSARKKPSSARQEQKLVAEMTKKMDELTRALAVANEQETLAKAQAQKIRIVQQESAAERDHLLEQMNRLKQENWSLSLALQVTERHQRL